MYIDISYLLFKTTGDMYQMEESYPYRKLRAGVREPHLFFSYIFHFRFLYTIQVVRIVRASVWTWRSGVLLPKSKASWMFWFCLFQLKIDQHQGKTRNREIQTRLKCEFHPAHSYLHAHLTVGRHVKYTVYIYIYSFIMYNKLFNVWKNRLRRLVIL